MHSRCCTAAVLSFKTFSSLPHKKQKQKQTSPLISHFTLPLILAS